MSRHPTGPTSNWSAPSLHANIRRYKASARSTSAEDSWADANLSMASSFTWKPMYLTLESQGKLIKYINIHKVILPWIFRLNWGPRLPARHHQHLDHLGAPRKGTLYGPRKQGVAFNHTTSQSRRHWNSKRFWSIHKWSCGHVSEYDQKGLVPKLSILTFFTEHGNKFGLRKSSRKPRNLKGFMDSSKIPKEI